jgi:8-oxo-dGTP diphosphatase
MPQDSRWTGKDATVLRRALHMTEGRFARMIGVSERAVSHWAAHPETTPRAAVQDRLDDAFAEASAAVKARFEQLHTERPSLGNAQALRIAIAVVLRDDEVLLVRRRDGTAGIAWQFPAGIVKPGEHPEDVAVRETLGETGIHCSVAERIGGRLHPVTGVLCDYFRCGYLAGDAANLDTVENSAVVWTPRSDVGRFIERDTIYPPVLMILEGQHDSAVR